MRQTIFLLGGKFDHDQINDYLGFFEDIGLYYKMGALDKEIIDHMFGAIIMETYENGEIRKYVTLARKNAAQPQAYERFYEISRALEEQRTRSTLAEEARIRCQQTPPPK